MAHLPLKLIKKKKKDLQPFGTDQWMSKLLTHIHPRNQPTTSKGACNESKVSQQAKMGEILHWIRQAIRQWSPWKRRDGWSGCERPGFVPDHGARRRKGLGRGFQRVSRTGAA